MDLFDFSKDPTLAQITTVDEGFRLQALEVYNWGTFDQMVWSFALNGQTSLLTGDVGSGKSTIVDALSTLLIAPRKIDYNKAADASSKERTVTSYVRGYYGQQRTTDGRTGKAQALRAFDKHSVLLAIFHDATQDKYVTLAQMFWFPEPNGAPQRLYVVAQKALHIATEFASFASIRVLKQRLKSSGHATFDNFTAYSEYFYRQIGGLDAQAMDLFQQTISMKKVDKLTEFVRHSMLERSDMTADITNLLKHYTDLNSAHAAVVSAKKQLELLTPLVTRGTAFRTAEQTYNDLDTLTPCLTPWMALQLTPLFATALQTTALEQDKTTANITKHQQALSQIETDLKAISLQIFQNGGGRLAQLKQQLDTAKTQQKTTNDNLARYHQHADVLSFPHIKSLTTFQQNRANIAPCLAEQQQRQETYDTQKTDHLITLKQAQTEDAQLAEELHSLKQRKSNLPIHLIKLRTQLCTALHLPEETLPFIGELLEVKESELAWEGALERLLHGFALSLLVSPKDYPAVSTWINQNHLGAKLVYFHATMDKNAQTSTECAPDSVLQKLNIHPDTPFAPWLTHRIATQFHYHCTKQQKDFQAFSYALSQTGQIKSGTRHEKDDRKKLSDRSTYLLGFSNEKKIAVLETMRTTLAKTMQAEQATLRTIETALRTIQTMQRALDALAQFEEFTTLDIATIRAQIKDYQAQITALEQSNNLLQTLQAQEVTLQSKRTTTQEKINQLQQTYGQWVEKHRTLQTQSEENQARFQEIPSHCIAPLQTLYTTVLDGASLTLRNKDAIAQRCSDTLRKHLADANETRHKLHREIERDMQRFAVNFPSQCAEMDQSILSLPDYVRLHEQLQTDNLPQLETKFRQLLRTNTLQQILAFQSALMNHYTNVRQRIDDINSSLHDIDYNDGRYITIEYRDNLDWEIKQFRADLRECTQGFTSEIEDEHAAQTRFDKIKKILERLKAHSAQNSPDATWAKKVTDVRMWLEFSASERFRDTGEEYEHYADSNGKSGGQKEKLAYTILAASLVYNYGMHQSYNSSTFRFVTIDEAFLKSSDESARYGLSLFQKLNFQLLIVTPLLKIPTIEPFISHVGFVHHDDISHRSTLTNVSIEEYRRKRTDIS